MYGSLSKSQIEQTEEYKDASAYLNYLFDYNNISHTGEEEKEYQRVVKSFYDKYGSKGSLL